MLGLIVFAFIAVQDPPTASPSPPPQPSTAAPQATTEKPWPPDGVFRMSEVKPPRLMKEVKPKYTADALRAKIEGVVVLEAIVERDGKVGAVRVQRSLDREHGLDDEAIAALKRWLFAPAMKDGNAVPVLVEVELTFSLRKR